MSTTPDSSVVPLNANYHPKGLNSNIFPLPLSDLNVVVVTDVHSWVGGHGSHSPSLVFNADYGDVLSFVERLRRKCKRQGKDVFFVMNGDYVDGSGLGAEEPPVHLVPLLQRMSWDALNVGNHEMYYNGTALYDDFREFWGARYVTSNVVLASNPEEPLGGSRYTILEGAAAGSKLLVFGFLYDMQDASPVVQVQPVEEVVEQEWFTQALTATDDYSFDAILVLAHMGVRDPLVEVLLKKIRSVAGHHVAVQFITGHTHFRRYAVLDKYATSLEAGKYLDTVGFASFPRHDTIRAVNKQRNDTDTTPEQLERDPSLAAKIASQFFSYTYLDANKDILWQALQLSPEEQDEEELPAGSPEEEATNFTVVVPPHQLSTRNGTILSNLIATTQESLGLLKVVGCSPAHYYIDVTQPVMALDSLWGLFVREVWKQTPIYEQARKENKKALYIQSPGNFRYDLWEGPQTVNDVYGVSPYNDTVVVVVSSLRGQALMDALAGGSDTPNAQRTAMPDMPEYALPEYIVAGLDQADEDHAGGRIDPHAVYNVYTGAYDYPALTRKFREVLVDDDDNETKFFPPHTPVQVNQVEWTNTYMWQAFLQQSWPCNSNDVASPKASSSSSSGPSEMTQMVGTFALSFILLLLGCYGGFYLRDFCLRRRHKARLTRDRLLQLAPRRGRAAAVAATVAPTLVLQDDDDDDDDDDVELERPASFGRYNKVAPAAEQDDEDDDEVVFSKNGREEGTVATTKHKTTTTEEEEEEEEEELGGVHTLVYETGAQIT